MTIYLDAIIILNIVFDYMILLLTRSLGKGSTTSRRLFFGAIIASIAVPLTLYYPNSLITHPIGKGIYSCFIILSGFHFINFYHFFKNLFIFYFITFAIGGGLFGLHFMFQESIILERNDVLILHPGFGDPLSWLFVIIGFPTVYFFTKNRMDKLGISKIKYDQIYPLTLTINQKTFTTSAFIDSGNQLIDPLTNYPVLIGDEFLMKQWFTNEDWLQLKNAHKQLDTDQFPNLWMPLLHIIPYQSVAGKSQFMLAIRPDRVSLLYEEKTYVTNEVLIGIQFGEMTKDRLYHCLLHPQLLNIAKTH